MSSTTTSVFNPIVLRILIGEIIGLRHRVLRPGLPLKEASFDGDDKYSTWHIGTFLLDKYGDRGPAVCCASFMLNSFDNQEAWQLRGMATDPAYEGRGLGTSLLTFAGVTIPSNSGIKLFWCNARLAYVDFYEKRGWRCVSDVFDIPTVGPHRKMIKNLQAA
jgi:GNAT superfamily N-acetyltransferase